MKILKSINEYLEPKSKSFKSTILFNYNNFRLLENKQQAEKILRDNHISRTNSSYVELKKACKETFGSYNYLGFTTRFLIEQKVAVQELIDLLKWLKHNNTPNRLNKDPLQYTEFEELKDEITIINNEKKANKIYQELISDQKQIISKLSDEDRKIFNNWAIKVHDYRNFDPHKISKLKTFEEIIDYLKAFVKQNEGLDTISDKRQEIIDTPGAKLIYYNDDVLVAEIEDYEASDKLGSHDWCIVTSEPTFKSYVTRNNSKQYFIWDYTKDIVDDMFQIGVTVDDNNHIRYAHNMKDLSIKSSLPSYIKKLRKNGYLKPISAKEITERKRKRKEALKDTYEDDQELRTYAEALIEMFEENDIHEDFNIYNLEPNDHGHYDMKAFRILGGYDEYEEWAVGTDEEADSSFQTSMKNLIDELGYSAFSEGFAEYYIDGEDFANDFFEGEEDHYRDNFRDYNIEGVLISSIEREINEKEEEISKLEEERDNLDASEDDYDEKYGELDEQIDDLNIEIDDLKEDDDNYEVDEDELDSYVEGRKQEIADNPISYLKDELGYDDDSLRDAIKNYIDEDKLIDAVQESDGRGNSLSGYDGIENEVQHNDTTYYAYRIN